jgi:hypothetical protein
MSLLQTPAIMTNFQEFEQIFKNLNINACKRTSGAGVRRREHAWHLLASQGTAACWSRSFHRVSAYACDMYVCMYVHVHIHMRVCLCLCVRVCGYMHVSVCVLCDFVCAAGQDAEYPYTYIFMCVSVYMDIHATW